jgi:hypothetical protein
LRWFSSFVLLGLSSPALAQYAGPAILSRGEAPAAMTELQIKFRPAVDISATYDSGLSGVGLDNRGDLSTSASPGVMLNWGVGGAHKWRHTSIGLDYHGSLIHYTQQRYYDSVNQTLLLGLTHRFSPHTSLVLHESAGIFSRSYFLPTLTQTVPFDPSGSNIPTSDFFDNQTIYQSTQADFSYMRSTRLSFDLGGSGFVTRRRSSALTGVVGANAHGDLQYRVSRRSTLGMAYSYAHFDYTHAFGGTDMHGVKAVYSIRFTRFWELSAFGGPMRVESKYLTTIAVDPVIAALLGINSGVSITHSITTIPNVGGRLSRTFAQGVAYVSAGHDVTAGNGLFLTSYTTTAIAGYSYTGLRRWSFGASVGLTDSSASGVVGGQYRNVTGGVSFSRRLNHGMHLMGSMDMRQYSSVDYANYNRMIYGVRMGIGFSPGELPLRIR